MIRIKQIFKQNNSHGFTLIEVMIALAIFSIGILGLASLQVRATTSNNSARLFTDSISVAQSQIELLMTIPYTNAALTSASAIGVPSAQKNGTVRIISNGVDIDYATRWFVIYRDLNGDGTADYKDISLTVSDPSGDDRFTSAFSRAISFAN